MLDNMFSNVYLPESLFSNVYLQGSVLMRTPGGVMTDSVIDGDVVIGDGVGNGDVAITNTTIVGRLVIRGGGPSSVILSNTHITGGIYVASFGSDTHISVTNGSTVPILEAISGFTLSGSGIQDVTILENVRRGSIVNLTGVNLIDLNIIGSGADIRLNSGYAINARFESGGQDSRLTLSPNSSIGQLTVLAPNVNINGTGTVQNAFINNSGVVVQKAPELLTLGVNVTATIGGQSISSTETQWANSDIDRVSAFSTLRVQLLTGGRAPFNQASLSLNMISGRAATEVHLSQAAANRVPLTQRNSRWGYWTGYFVPAPQEAGNLVTLTYCLCSVSRAGKQGY
jgi:hypothetical protein